MNSNNDYDRERENDVVRFSSVLVHWFLTLRMTMRMNPMTILVAS